MWKLQQLFAIITLIIILLTIEFNKTYNKEQPPNRITVDSLIFL